jgi:hypothetical protein
MLLKNRKYLKTITQKIIMNYIVNNEKLIIQYIPGNGAWTYQLIVQILKG